MDMENLYALVHYENVQDILINIWMTLEQLENYFMTSLLKQARTIVQKMYRCTEMRYNKQLTV